MAMNFHQSTVALSGRFPDFTKGELEILFKSRGAWRVAGSPGKGFLALFSAEDSGKKVDKANALGVPVVLADGLREALGPPLGGYRQRLEALHADKPRAYHYNHTFAVGAPAPAEVLARVEERIGFELPEAALNLWSQLDGLSWLWTSHPMGSENSDALLPWNEACHQDGPLWRSLSDKAQKHKGFGMGLIAIPSVETIFFTEWDDRMFSSDAYGARDKIKLGKRAVNAREFFANFFLFDFFHPYYQAGLWADPESRELHVVYGNDYGADWGMAATVPLEVYMEALLVERGVRRPIVLNSKLGATSSIVNYAHLPYIVLEPYRNI